MMKIKTLLRKHQAGLWLVLMAVGLVLPQLIARNVVINDDSLFHLNRFYESARQIRYGNFSWFQMNYSFSQSGRIVNALYGPLFSYVAGLILLIVHRWFLFQVVMNLAVEIIAGLGMLKLSKALGADQKFSLLASLMFMVAGAIPAWLTNSQFTAWGTALLPFVLLFGVQMLHRDGVVKPWRFGVTMALIVQTHLLSAVFAVLVLLPFFIYGLHIRPAKRNYVWRVVAAAGVCIVLTANIWGSLLEVYGTNHLVPPFSPISMSAYATKISLGDYGLGVAPELGLVLSIVVISQVLIIIKQKAFLAPEGWFTMVGTGFLILSSTIVPWEQISRHWPTLANYLQFPTRLRAVALVLMIAASAVSLSHVTLPSWRYGLQWIGVGMVAMLGFQSFNAVARPAAAWARPEVFTMPTGADYRYANMQQVKGALVSRDLSKLINNVEKPAPDYLPLPTQYVGTSDAQTSYRQYMSVTVPIINGAADTQNTAQQLQQIYANNASAVYRKTVINNPVALDTEVLSHGRLQYTWQATKSGRVQLPIVAYQHSQVQLNQQMLAPTARSKRQNSIGALTVNQRAGKNTLILAYQPALITSVLIWLALLAWVGLLGTWGVNHFRRWRRGTKA